MRIAIIGAGAAGCFAAANMPYQKGVEVVIFEKSAKALQKVKVSGGGRCNVTHACFDVPELITRYPRGQRFLRKTLYKFSPQNTIDWFANRGVELKIEEDGRMFPTTNNSQTIIDCLLQEVQKNKIDIKYSKAVDEIHILDNKFNICFKDKTNYQADRVLITCGGFPKKEQYSWIENLGHSIEPPVPSLFTFNLPKHPITELMGVAVQDVSIKIAGTKLNEQGPILITHWGFSGPVVLKCSAWGAEQLNKVNYDFNLIINWLGIEYSESSILDTVTQLRQENGKQLIAKNAPFNNIPKRLWSYIINKCEIADHTKWGELAAKSQRKLIQTIVADEYHVFGKTTFKEEFVTCGGIKLSEVNPQTLESRLCDGLYFAGEILNIDGITGGYNFQHAWSSGSIAAQHITIPTNNT